MQAKNCSRIFSLNANVVSGMKMKITFVMLMLLATRGVCEKSYALKKSQQIYPAIEGRGIGEIRRLQVHRGLNKVYERNEIDTDQDGKIDSIQQIFWIKGEALLSISDNKDGKGHHFTSVGDFSVSIQDQDKDGEMDHVMVISADFGLIEMYRRREDGFYEPIPEKEFIESIKGVESIAPFTNSVLDSIQPEKSGTNSE